MTGYVITKRVLDRWTYYLEYLELNGMPIWNGLVCNGKTMNLTNCLLVLDKLRKCYPKQDFDYMEY